MLQLQSILDRKGLEVPKISQRYSLIGPVSSLTSVAVLSGRAFVSVPLSSGIRCATTCISTRPLFSIAILPFSRAYCFTTTVAIFQTGPRHSLRTRPQRFSAFPRRINTPNFPIATVSTAHAPCSLRGNLDRLHAFLRQNEVLSGICGRSVRRLCSARTSRQRHPQMR
jgi:hypothetical protein